jgi:hypothetical protein
MNSIERFAIALYDNGFLKGNGTEINNLLEYYKEIYQDEIEAAIIKQCAEESTSAAHKKEIHRQQIVAAYKAAMGTEYLESHIMTRYGAVHKAHDYYNQTYGDGIQ